MLASFDWFFFKKFRNYETRRHELNYLFWECTTRCNLNCLHCGSDCSSNSAYRDMPFEDFSRALNTIKHPAKNFTVVFTGGEPLLRKDLEQCGKAIRKQGMRWSIVTNGYLYTEERQNSLLNAGLGALTISLDGLEETHNWLRNNTSSFEKVSNAIHLAANSRRLNFDVVTCMHQKNVDELPLIKDNLIALGVKSWRLFTIIPIGRAKENELLHLNAAQFKQVMDFIATSRNDKRIDVKFSCEGYVGVYEKKVRDSRYFCRAGINIGSVLIDGSISACPNIDRYFVQGNIYSDDFMKIWNNKFEDFRNREWTKTGKCASCKEYPICMGNGFHNWHGDKKEVLVCHHEKIKEALKAAAK